MVTTSLSQLAQAALGVLAENGARRVDTEGGRWQARLEGPGGAALDILCTGPDLPTTVPAAVAPPDLIVSQRPWVGAYRLIVTAPLIVFDLAWNPDEPLRILTFSRGDWEADLLAMAG